MTINLDKIEITALDKENNILFNEIYEGLPSGLKGYLKGLKDLDVDGFWLYFGDHQVWSEFLEEDIMYFLLLEKEKADRLVEEALAARAMAGIGTVGLLAYQQSLDEAFVFTVGAYFGGEMDEQWSAYHLLLLAQRGMKRCMEEMRGDITRSIWVMSLGEVDDV